MPHSIIYLDDEADLCSVFEDFFELSDFSVKTFMVAEKLLDYINNHQPDIILLDYRLPGITGIEVAKKIKIDVPMVLVSGDLGLQTPPPFVASFQKPLDFSELKAFFNSILRKVG